MKYTFAFSSLTAALFALAGSVSSPAGTALAITCALAAAGLALAYARRSPTLLGKRADGSIGPFAWLVFWPYITINFASLWAFQRLVQEEPISEIVPGLYLGRRLLRGDREVFEQCAIASTLDLTAEFPEVPFARSGRYLCIPLLDTLPPTQHQLALTAEWIGDPTPASPVFVHCAMGHGRSASIVAAYLLHAGHAATVREALALLSKRRPGVGLNTGQVQALEDYAASRARTET